MADLDAAIRAALDNAEHGDRPDGGMCHVGCCGDGYVCECGLHEKPRAALRAVLDIHAPFMRYPDTQPEYVRCSGCSFPNVTSIEWPCATVRVIAAHLGVPQAEKPQP